MSAVVAEPAPAATSPAAGQATDPAVGSGVTTPTSRILPLPFSRSAVATDTGTSTMGDGDAVPFELITQGAEALLYKTTFFDADTPAALKIRPSKPWRHPHLDRRLTRARVLAEARVLVRCAREGVRVPAVWALDWEAGWLACQWIPGRTVKAALREWSKGNVETSVAKSDDGLHRLLERMGSAVGKLHAVGVIHGDLTTSNMMLEQAEHESGPEDVLRGEIVLIDFGLATQASQEEDRAVDLYVLERAFGSTHPREEHRFDELLQAYAKSYKGANVTLKRLEDVRMRGRKKSMIG